MALFDWRQFPHDLPKFRVTYHHNMLAAKERFRPFLFLIECDAVRFLQGQRSEVRQFVFASVEWINKTSSDCRFTCGNERDCGNRS